MILNRKMEYIYIMKYYSAEKNNDIMKFAGKWNELENIILSDVTQTQKDRHVRMLSILDELYIRPIAKCGCLNIAEKH
ncbi:hypothetical protein STEG23_031197 [Scotinomys teguina]